jgi:hypothetical protein
VHIKAKWNLMIVIFDGVMLALSLLRLYSLYRSDYWIWNHGREYAIASLSIEGDITPLQRESLYNSHHGNYFPFGVKGYRLTKWARGFKGRKKVFKPVFFLLRKTWGFYYFCPLVSAYLVLVGTGSQNPVSRAQRLIEATASYVLIVWALFICAEAVLAYIRIRSWGALYHGMSHKDVSINGGSLSEIKVAVGAALMTLIGTTAAFFSIASRYPTTYTSIDDKSALARLGDSAFYAFSTLAGNRDPGARTGPGKTAVGLTSLTGLVFLAAVLGLLLTYIGTEATSMGARTVKPSAAPEAGEPDSEAVAKSRQKTILAGGLSILAVVAYRIGRKY